MSRAGYAALRLAEAMLSAGSRFINAAFLGGSTSISISARAALGESDRWRRARIWIDRAFWFEPNHCARALDREVALAWKTLAQVAARKD